MSTKPNPLLSYLGRLVGHNPLSASPCGKLGGAYWELTRSHLSLKWGRAGIATNNAHKPHQEGVVIQVYWPYLRFVWAQPYPGCPYQRRDLSAIASTTFRVAWIDDYYGAAFKVLGFGLGFDYQAAPVAP